MNVAKLSKLMSLLRYKQYGKESFSDKEIIRYIRLTHGKNITKQQIMEVMNDESKIIPFLNSIKE